MSKARIFQNDIHNTNYLAPYRRAPTTAESLIAFSGREVESLSGEWRFTIDPYDTALRAGWPLAAGAQKLDGGGSGAGGKAEEVSARRPPDYDVDGWEAMHVPSCWNLADRAYFWYEGSACYFRTFDIALAEDERVFLCFEGVAGDAYVFLNQKQVAYHRGGSTPFCVEVGGSLHSGTNTVFVVADNARGDDRVPMSNTDWFNYGGIYRDVFLVRVPPTFIRGYRVGLSESGGISVQVDVDRGAGERGGEAVDTARVRIPELGVDEAISLSGSDREATRPGSAGQTGSVGQAGSAGQTGGVAGNINLNLTPELWSPENPKLYDVELSVGDDVVCDRIGFRTIERRGRQIYLNGEPVFLRGVSCHEDDPALGKTSSEATIRRDLQTARELGCNFVRLAHYPHSREAARVADEMGMMLWEEVPVYWAIDFANPATAADAQNQLRELVLRDVNRASVIVWSVGNENPDSDERFEFMSALVDVARGVDGTRLVSAACLYNHEQNVISDRLAERLDVIGINQYFGWYDPAYEKLPDMLERSDPDRPVVLTEFGGGALAGHRGTTEELFTEDRQREIYRRQIEAIRACSYVKGMTPWILFDFRCPRRTNRYQRFYNLKGLLAADHRTRKLAFGTLRAFYEGGEPGRLAREG
ncbi:MAG: glycoside hydrolase family 2 protein [Spirochaetia bacterium]